MQKNELAESIVALFTKINLRNNFSKKPRNHPKDRTYTDGKKTGCYTCGKKYHKRKDYKDCFKCGSK